MADLPIELWHLIFNRLELADISSCALVSRALYSTVKAYRVREIAFTRRVDKWFHSEYSTYRHQVDYSMASVLKRSPFNFDFLKRLKIGRFSAIDDLNVINKFTQLEELDIDLKNYRNEQSRTLSLVNLRMLHLFMSEHLQYLELDTPRLEKLRTFSLKGLEFFYPESIQSIHAFHFAEKLPMFRNLEYLIITRKCNQLDYHDSYDSDGIQEFSLRCLKKLKEIDISTHSSFLWMNQGILKKIFANILALGRPDLKVFWISVQITSADHVAEYFDILENDGNPVLFQLRNYEKLKDNFQLSLGDFNGFLRGLQNAGFNPRSEEFFSKLFSRYSLMLIVVNGEVKEREVLMELIVRSPKLWRLEFSESCLDQSFFDQMADAVRLKNIPLRLLSLKGASNDTMNLDFVSKLLDLESFETNQPPSSELISRLLRLPWLAEMVFSSSGHRIQRTKTGQFLLNGNPISLQELSRQFDEKPHSTAPRAATVKTPEPARKSTGKSTDQCSVM